MDDYNRRCLAAEVDTSLPGGRVVRVLEGLRELEGLLDKAFHESILPDERDRRAGPERAEAQRIGVVELDARARLDDELRKRRLDEHATNVIAEHVLVLALDALDAQGEPVREHHGVDRTSAGRAYPVDCEAWFLEETLQDAPALEPAAIFT